jgi:hypothetical protein
MLGSSTLGRSVQPWLDYGQLQQCHKEGGLINIVDEHTHDSAEAKPAEDWNG